MISVIVCSVSETTFRVFEENVSFTIGVPFEVIRIDNGSNKYSICSAYNEGAARAQYPMLCFAHEDIEMQTTGWGSMVLDLFNLNSQLGLLGVAGTAYKPLSPSGWWYENAKQGLHYTHYIQSDKEGSKALEMFSNPGGQSLASVVCVDGLWFCTPRHIALHLKFDDGLFRGFHCYDVDYSLTVFQHYQVAVSNEILVKHFSGGSHSPQWINDTLKLYRKWKKVLPLATVTLGGQWQKKEEVVALDYFLQQMLYYLPIRQTIFNFWALKGTSLVGFFAFLRMHWRIVRRFLHWY